MNVLLRPLSAPESKATTRPCSHVLRITSSAQAQAEKDCAVRLGIAAGQARIATGGVGGGNGFVLNAGQDGRAPQQHPAALSDRL